MSFCYHSTTYPPFWYVLPCLNTQEFLHILGNSTAASFSLGFCLFCLFFRNKLILNDLAMNISAVFGITLEFCAQDWLSCLMGCENLDHSGGQNKGPEVTGRVENST